MPRLRASLAGVVAGRGRGRGDGAAPAVARAGCATSIRAPRCARIVARLEDTWAAGARTASAARSAARASASTAPAICVEHLSPTALAATWAKLDGSSRRALILATSPFLHLRRQGRARQGRAQKEKAPSQRPIWTGSGLWNNSRATYSPTEFPLQYHRPWNSPSSRWDRVWPLPGKTAETFASNAMTPNLFKPLCLEPCNQALDLINIAQKTKKVMVIKPHDPISTG